MKKVILSAIPICVLGAAILFCALLGCGLGPVIKAEAAEQSESAEKERKIAYISTLGQLLSFTFDYYNDIQSYEDRFGEEYTLILTQDLDLATDTSWHEYAPDWQNTGWPVRSFFPELEGGGHTIYNLWCRPLDEDGGGRWAGLFQSIYNDIRNLNIVWDDSKIMPPQSDIWDFYGDYGGLAGDVIGSKVSNVHVKAKFASASIVGGLAAYSINGEFDNCSFEGEIEAVQGGGIIGFGASTSSVTNCLFKGKLRGFGLGGITQNHNLGQNPPDVRYASNVVIIEDLEFVDMGIYNEQYYPVGALIGFATYRNLERFTFENNYVYIASGITDEIREISAQHTDAPSHVIGGPTEPCDLSDGELAHVSDLTDKSAFSGLDFERYWTMDEKGHPVTKRNFVSIINLSPSEYDENYIVRTERRYYESDETASIQSTIRDKSDCQIVYYTLDGTDALNVIGNSNVTLYMNTSHVIVTKAGPLGEMVIEGLEGVSELQVNGQLVAPIEGAYRFKYRLGDEISVAFSPNKNYVFTGFKSPDGYEFTQEDGVYTLKIPIVSNLEGPVILNAALESLFQPPADGGDNKAVIIGASVGGAAAAAIAAGVTIGLIRRKRRRA